MVYGDTISSMNSNSNSNSNMCGNIYAEQPRIFNGQYSSHSLSINNNNNSNSNSISYDNSNNNSYSYSNRTSTRSLSPLIGEKNKRGYSLGSSTSPEKQSPKRANSKINQRLIDALAKSNAYDDLPQFDSGSNPREAISLAVANSVNKYHLLPLQQQEQYRNKIKEMSKHNLSTNLPDDYENEDENNLGGSDDGEDRVDSGGDPGRSVNNKLGLIFTSEHSLKLQESIRMKKQKEEDKKLKTAEKEDKDKSDALVLHVLKTKYLAEYNGCSPEDQVKFASVKLSKVNVPELIQIYKSFTGKGRGELNSRELLLNAIMEQIRK